MAGYGTALQARREQVGYRSQSDLARAVRALHEEGDLPAGLRPFSQQWLSRLEEDTDGQVLLSARAQQLRALAYMLGWTAAEFETEVGVPLGSVPLPSTRAAGPDQAPDAQQQGWEVQPARRPIPGSLREAAEVFGARAEWAELREGRWLRFLTDLHHRRTPQTAGEWLDLFLDLRKRFDPPALPDQRGEEDAWTP